MIERALEHHRAGRLAEAATIYQEILRERPDDADAWYLLGVVAHQAGEPERAVELMGRSLEILPDQARCLGLLGIDLLALGRAEEAEAAWRRAIELEPSVQLYVHLAGLRMRQGRADEAAGAYREALALDLRHAPAAVGMGRALLQCGRKEEAVQFLKGAAVELPDNAEVHCELGDALQSMRQFTAALEAYRRALALDPKLGRAWYSAGCAESSRKEFTSAIGCFRHALEIAPDWPEAQHNLGRAWFQLGQVEEAMDGFRRAAAGRDPVLPLATIALVIPGDPRSGNQAVLEARREWAERHLPPGRPGKRGARGERLKIGYVSSFFPDRNWMKPVWGLINHHDRERFEIHLFSDAPAARIEHGYRAHSRDGFHEVSGLSNDALARRIEEAAIDLLVDLNGYSAMERLPMIALRPAPAIAGWFNLYATTGMAGYDYLIGDERVIPPEEERFYCEKIVRVPGSYLTFEVTYPVPPVADPPCLASGSITFGSLAPQYKVTRDAIAAWSRILREVPHSSMLMKNRELESEGARQFVREMFEAQGIGSARLRLEGPAEHYRFLETYGAIDIALDTFPYNGGTTTTESIWQGVPVVAFSGDRWVSRTSASILHAGGLGACIGKDLEEYVSIAIGLASSADRLVELRRGMRARLQESAVCDTPAFARNMERIYSEMVDL